MKQKFRFFKRFQAKAYAGGILAVLALLALVVGLSACGMGNTPNRTDLFEPDEGKLPPAAELEEISEADVLGRYQGSTYVQMDGKQYGPYTEKIRLGRTSVGNNLFFRAEKTVYESMPVDIGYEFEKTALSDTEFTLTPASDGKSFSFEGKNGSLSFYPKRSDEPRTVPSQTSIKGFIYKKDGKVYIHFHVEYDTAATRKTFPTIPEGSHNSMSSAMNAGVKQ